MIQKQEFLIVALSVLCLGVFVACKEKNSTNTAASSKNSETKAESEAAKKEREKREREEEEKARAAETAKLVTKTRTMIRSLQIALEAYNTDVGFYPRDGKNTPGADIPDFLFAALNNKPTVKFGGGPNTPYFDAYSKDMGMVNADGIAQPLEEDAVPSTVQFQEAHLPRKAGDVKAEDTLKSPTFRGKPLYLDPWGQPFHYREWASKSKAVKEQWSEAKKGVKQVRNPRHFQIWSNGPDRVNNYGAKGSDDIKNWSD